MYQTIKSFPKMLQITLIALIILALASCAAPSSSSASASTIDYTVSSQQVIPGNFEFPTYSSLHIPYGELYMEGDFFNPESNNVTLSMSFYLSEGNQLFYQSNQIAPGEHLSLLEMKDIFPQGSYDMYIVYEAFTMDGTYATCGTATVDCVLVVA